jgi:hypothetical protein
VGIQVKRFEAVIPYIGSALIVFGASYIAGIAIFH